MVVTNTQHGGTMRQQLQARVDDRRTKAVKFLAGYVGAESIEWLLRITQSRPVITIEILCGMGYREGLSADQYARLVELDDILRARDPKSRQGVYVFASGPEGSRRRGLHGKAYLIEGIDRKELFVGSSNFSDSGLGDVDNRGKFTGNVEVNSLITDSLEVSRYEAFYEELHQNHALFGNSKSTRQTSDKWMAVPINEIESFPIKGVAGKRRRSRRRTPDLKKGQVPSGFKAHPYVDIDLARNVDAQAGSNLNA